MANRFDEIVLLAKDTFERVSSSPGDWVDFLKTASRNYRYSFSDQLLVYAQRPDAKACAPIELWNNRMHCWVNRGAKGIALIDDSSERQKLRYVFDVSDVHRSRVNGVLPKLWEMQENYETDVIRRLEGIYGKTNEARPFADRLIELSNRIAAEYAPDVVNDLIEVQESSSLSGLDEFNVEMRLRETLGASIAYSLLSRCDEEADAYLGDLNFDYITDFDSPETLSVLGTATTDMCEPVLMEIGRTIEVLEKRAEKEEDKNIEAQIDRTFAKEITEKIKTEKSSDKGLENESEHHYNALKRESEDADKIFIKNTEKTENEAYTKPVTNNEIEEGGTSYGDNLQTGRGLSDTEPDTSGGTTGDTHEVRNAETDISEGESQGNLQRETSDGNTSGALPHDSEAGRGESREDNRTSDEGRAGERGTEGSGPDGMGTQKKFDSEQSRRDSSEGDRLQPIKGSELEKDSLSTLNPAIKYEQMSLFPYLTEQMGTILAAEAETNVKTSAAFSISDENIAEILKTGSGQKDSRARIFEKYREEHTPEYMSEFLRKEYRTGGKGFEINGKDISVWYNADGMNIAYGRSAMNSPDVHLTWDEIESRTRNIIEAGEYLTINEAFISEQTYRAELADNIYFFYRDAISEEPKGFELKQNNYPDSTEQIREMLSTPEGAVTIRDDILDRVDALRRGEIEQHWRLNPSPEELAEKITGFAGPKRELPTKDSVEIMSESFITQDEIDSVLSGGSGFAGGKFRIYDFVMEGHDRKELADFLKKEYGTGGRTSAISGSWHSYEDYDAKGIQLQKGNIMEPYAKVLLNWNVVSKRIEQLVFENRYLTPEQKEEHDRKALEAAQADIADSENVLLDKAINLINDYCIDEFLHEADFSDRSNVELAYTEVTDEETGIEHTVQVSADLIDYSISMFIDDEKLDTEKYESLEALIEYELNYLNFDSLVSVPDDVWDKVRERDSVSSEHTESVSTEHTDSDIENEGITSNNITDSGSVDKNALEMQDNALERLNEGIEFADSEEETSGRKVQKLDSKNYHIRRTEL